MTRKVTVKPALDPTLLVAARSAKAAKPAIKVRPEIVTPDQRYEMALKAQEVRTARHAALDKLRNI
jgi:hypothetical protein